mmetsp:Transcript_45457/g.119419  ORF Transcript_45457/g.119419 Transcript_45457/m.119419 type:complete len:260 (-) Transcript_45457:1615-2394(-)
MAWLTSKLEITQGVLATMATKNAACSGICTLTPCSMAYPSTFPRRSSCPSVTPPSSPGTFDATGKRVVPPSAYSRSVRSGVRASCCARAAKKRPRSSDAVRVWILVEVARVYRRSHSACNASALSRTARTMSASVARPWLSAWISTSNIGLSLGGDMGAGAATTGPTPTSTAAACSQSGASSPPSASSKTIGALSALVGASWPIPSAPVLGACIVTSGASEFAASSPTGALAMACTSGYHSRRDGSRNILNASEFATWS